MLYSDELPRKPLCFVHIPKTGGRSINHYIRDNELAVKINGHARTVQGDYRTFAVVRDPYTRYVSAVNYARAAKEPQEKMIRALLAPFNREIDLDFIHLFSEELISSANVFCRQTEYKKRMNLDVVYKYENGLQAVIDDLKEVFGSTEMQSLKTVNVSPPTFSVAMLTRAHKDAINSWYDADFSVFGYTKS